MGGARGGGGVKSPDPIRLPSLLIHEISTQCKPCRINRKQETVVCPMKTVGAKSRARRHTMPAIIAEINSRIDIYLIFDDTRDGLWRFGEFRQRSVRRARSKFARAEINIPFHVIGQFEYQEVK